MYLEISGVPKILNNMRGNWRALWAEKAKWKKRTMTEAWNLRPKKPLKRAEIICTRCTSRPSDFDNRVSSFKAIIDGLTEIGVFIDDTDEVIVRREYLWEKCANKDAKVKIIVNEV